MVRRRISAADAAAAQRRLATILGQPSAGSVAEPAEPVQTDGPASPGLTLRSRRSEPESPSGRGAVGLAGRHRIGIRTSLGSVTPQHIVVVVLTVVTALVIGAWWVLRSSPHTEQLAAQHTSASLHPSVARSSASTSPSAVVASSTPLTTTGPRLVVDVAGRVRHPGIVRLPAGARVVDALRAAGGALPGVSLTSLNLARRVVDGEQILVGVRGSSVPPVAGADPTSTGPPIAPVDINTATEAELETLPDIGPVTAQAIIDWRVQNGAFGSVDDLLAVSGIGSATLADIRPYVSV